MTLNIISDLHCFYSEKTNSVIWNRRPFEDNITHEIITEDQYKTEEEKYALDKLNDGKKYVSDNMESLQSLNIKYDKWKMARCDGEIRKPKSFITLVNKMLSIITDKKKESNEEYLRNCLLKLKYYLGEAKYSEVFDFYRMFSAFMRKVCDFVPEKLQPADYLIVAGDLGLNDCYQKVYDELKERTKHLFKNVFYIKGNHDYWCHGPFDQRPKSINLDHRFIEENLDDNTVLIGCTMWAPVSEQDRWSVSRCMNDYNYIPKYTVDITNELYKEESDWIRQKMEQYKDKKVVIVTHHIPREECISESYKHSDVNAAYAVLDGSCKDIRPVLWISGHSHEYSDKTLDGVRYIRNPIGYRESYGYLPAETSSIHWYNTVIEV